MILHLKLITLQNNYKLKLLTLHSRINCLHNLKNSNVQITNNKNNPAYKNFAPVTKEQPIPSLLVSKNKETMKIKEMLMLDQNLLKSHLYITFLLPQTTEENDMIHAIEVEVIHEIFIKQKY